eukprot:scaffold360_cov374-Pavlova_lutheri.AAC.86
MKGAAPMGIASIKHGKLSGEHNAQAVPPPKMSRDASPTAHNASLARSRHPRDEVQDWMVRFVRPPCSIRAVH